MVARIFFGILAGLAFTASTMWPMLHGKNGVLFLSIGTVGAIFSIFVITRGEYSFSKNVYSFLSSAAIVTLVCFSLCMAWVVFRAGELAGFW